MTNTAEKLTLPLFMVKYNGDLLISTGRSRFETSWKNKTMSWAALLNKLSEAHPHPRSLWEKVPSGSETEHCPPTGTDSVPAGNVPVRYCNLPDNLLPQERLYTLSPLCPR